MRGQDHDQSALFSYFSPAARVPADHPLRPVREMTDMALRTLSADFAALYSDLGRRSVPPEKLLRALLLQILYSVRSERMLVEQLQYNLLFRWFVGLSLEDEVWDATTFSKNRERLIAGEIAAKFFAAVLEGARQRDLLSDEHFTVDGTLLEAWASQNSYQPKETPPETGSGSRGELLLRDTHECTTDADALMFRKSKAEPHRLCHMVHVLMENRSGLPVAARTTAATTQGEWEAAMEMLASLERGQRRITVGGDTGYDNAALIAQLRAIKVTPHFAQYTGRRSHLDGRTTRHEGYEISLHKRKSIEQIFGWLKNTALLRKLRHRGRDRVQWMFTLALSAYNLVRLRTLSVQPA